MHKLAYKKYLLILLMVILASNFLDRLALGIALQDIKHDLHVSDTHLGFLGGFAFAAFYAVMGIPIARWADRGNRVVIITLTTALWSFAVALCGAATTFIQLLAIRVGVAIGESGCVPPAHSLIAENFTRAERPRAVGVYTMGAPLSVIVGYFIAGWLNQLYGWRVTFIVLGLPGLVLAGLAWLTLKESRGVPQVSVVKAPALKDTWMALWGNVTFRRMLQCLAVSTFFSHGVMQWLPTFFIRSYGLQTGEIGTWLALSAGGCGLLGNYLGGVLASRYAASDERLQMRGIAVLWCLNGVFFALVYLVPNHQMAFVCLGLAMMVLAATNGPFFATIQTLVPENMRATSVAIITLFSNLIGFGLGPMAAGALSDLSHPLFGEESLRYSLLAMSPGFLWCTYQMWRAAGTVTLDLARANPAAPNASAEEDLGHGTVDRQPPRPDGRRKVAQMRGT